MRIILKIFLTLSLLVSILNPVDIIGEEKGDLLEAVSNVEGENRILVSSKENIEDLIEYEDLVLVNENTYLLSFEQEEELLEAIDSLSEIEAEISEEEEFEINGFDNISTIINSKISTDKKVVALIDTGSNTADETLSLFEDDGNDIHGHGTSMTNIIKNNSEVYVLSIKAVNDNGKGKLSNIYTAIQYAINEEVDYILLSLSAKDSDNMTALKSLITEAIEKGITVIASAGNNGEEASKYVPANINKVISIAYLDNDGYLGTYSNYGECVNYYLKANSTSVAAALYLNKLLNNNNEEIYTNYLSKEDIKENEEEKNEIEIIGGVIIDEDFIVNIERGVNYDTWWKYSVNYDHDVGMYSTHLYIDGATGFCADAPLVAAGDYQLIDTVYDKNVALALQHAKKGGSAYLEAQYWFWTKYMGTSFKWEGDASHEFNKNWYPSEDEFPSSTTTLSLFLDKEGVINVIPGESIVIKDSSNNLSKYKSNSEYVKIVDNTIYISFPTSLSAEEINNTSITLYSDESSNKGASYANYWYSSGEGNQRIVTGYYEPGEIINYESKTLNFKVETGDLEITKSYKKECDCLIKNNSAYNLEATYNLYTKQELNDKHLYASLKTDPQSGEASLKDIPAGTYYLYEVKASKGGKVNNYFSTIEIKANTLNVYDKSNVAVLENQCILKEINLILRKKDSAIDKRGDASLENAKFKFTFFNEKVNSNNYQNKKEVFSFIAKTNYLNNEYVISLNKAHSTISNFISTNDTKLENYYDSKGNFLLPSGTLMIEEIEAPKGYLKKGERYFIDLSIKNEEILINNSNDFLQIVEEEIIKAGIKVEKRDSENILNQGDASLNGTKLAIYNLSQNTVINNENKKIIATSIDNLNSENIVSTIIIQYDESLNKYIGKTKDNELDYGTYLIKELEASEGYLLNNDYYQIIEVRENNKVIELDPIDNQIIRGDVLINKHDKELKVSEGIAKNSLENIEFTIINLSQNPIYYRYLEGDIYKYKLVGVGEEVCKIYSYYDEELNAYIAKTENQALAYGTYKIYESNSNEAYLLSEEEYIFEIKEDSEVVVKDINSEEIIFNNQIIRADIKFNKKLDDNQARLASIWTLTNVKSGERHVVVTDKNGEFYSKEKEGGYSHSYNTNINDSLLERIDNDEIINYEEAEFKMGLWFSQGESISAEVDDNLGALPYGEYIIKEVRTDTNKNYGLREFNFFVYRDNVTIDLGTITDVIEKEDPYLSLATTALLDSNTNSIKDTIFITSSNYLKENEVYSIKGIVYNLKDKTVVSENSKDFLYLGASTSIETIDFKIDTSSLQGESLGVYEALYYNNELLAEHNVNLKESSQTVIVPKEVVIEKEEEEIVYVPNVLEKIITKKEIIEKEIIKETEVRKQVPNTGVKK